MSSLGDLLDADGISVEFRNLYSKGKSNGMPMKMLIAQEMSNDVVTRPSPNVIAKLMGLDTHPRQEADPSVLRNNSRSHSRSHSDIPSSFWEHNERKDIHEIFQKAPLDVKFHESINDERMVLVRQKFLEAIHLSMDEKLRQSKEFHDALEVLNSNKEMFLRCLQEPDSMFSQDLDNLRSIPFPPETKRITVLRPSKIANTSNFCAAGNTDGKQMNTSSSTWWKNCENTSQPTRIVVLKPCPVKANDLKVVNSPQSESSRIVNCEDFVGDVEDDGTDSREVAKVITKQMREKHIRRLHNDEAMLSNGYVGEQSSFNKSEIECGVGNLSNSEASSIICRHSWDYVNRIGSPCPTSSFGRVPHSSESSVCREAKRRLSERWALLASNGICQEKRHVHRSSSTLGEMLALSETKKAAVSDEERFLNEGPKCSNHAVHNDSITSENVSNSPRNLMRSNSVPVSSTSYGGSLDVDIMPLDDCKADFRKGETKLRGAKSSLKGRMTRFFFSRNKKGSEDKSLSSEIKDELQSPRIIPQQIFSGSENNEVAGHFLLGVSEPSNKTCSSSQLDLVNTIVLERTGLATEKSAAFGNTGEKLDQPSPVSVLDPMFDEDEHSTTFFQHHVNPDELGVEFPLKSIRSNLIDKSPRIGSIARTLSFDNSCVDTALSYSINQLSTSKGKAEEEREWFFVVKTLLSAAGLQGDLRKNKHIARWHSPESPLDPLLREKYRDCNNKEMLPEAKRRNNRSTWKLVFDCVNAALVEILGYGPLSRQRAIPCFEPKTSMLENASTTILDEVWTRVNIWFGCEFKRVSDDCGDDNSLALESLVRNEVVGKGWIDYLRLEMDNLGKEIEGKLLEELVQEAVIG